MADPDREARIEAWASEMRQAAPAHTALIDEAVLLMSPLGGWSAAHDSSREARIEAWEKRVRTRSYVDVGCYGVRYEDVDEALALMRAAPAPAGGVEALRSLREWVVGQREISLAAASSLDPVGSSIPYEHEATTLFNVLAEIDRRIANAPAAEAPRETCSVDGCDDVVATRRSKHERILAGVLDGNRDVIRRAATERPEPSEDGCGVPFAAAPADDRDACAIAERRSHEDLKGVFAAEQRLRIAAARERDGLRARVERLRSFVVMARNADLMHDGGEDRADARYRCDYQRCWERPAVIRRRLRKRAARLAVESRCVLIGGCHA